MLFSLIMIDVISQQDIQPEHVISFSFELCTCQCSLFADFIAENIQSALLICNPCYVYSFVYPCYVQKRWLPFEVSNPKKKDVLNVSGPTWLKNLYFAYTVVLRAIIKAAPFWEQEQFYTGDYHSDEDVHQLVQTLLVKSK